MENGQFFLSPELLLKLVSFVVDFVDNGCFHTKVLHLSSHDSLRVPRVLAVSLSHSLSFSFVHTFTTYTASMQQ
jgi:hypothetical protein